MDSPKKDTTPGYRWHLPAQVNATSDNRPQLRMLNSFTRRKELFVSNESRTIKWYSCGPTVYDVSHLGHARCYITFDILRRILANYFGYNVFYVMNITDIDDKIIKRARSNHLCDKFVENFKSGRTKSDQLLAEIRMALMSYERRRENETDPSKLEMMNSIVNNSKLAIEAIEKVVSSGPDDSSDETILNNLLQLRDVIADYQDEKFAHTVVDHQIFKALTLQYEQEYHEDMLRLNIMPPNALTRVSEFIDETGNYIKKLESNGFAYRSGGSVYFDTMKFDSDPKHSYAKLVREAFGHKKSLDDGEGELSVSQQHDTKKSPSDFALWKKSKSGEPSWTTQDYEAGRPGWHIECSVMASHLLGENFDIHSGGCDLKFPHHDNEIAQAEAYYNTGKNWVNYFIHSGHLTISGCKMSKSLKNFITIRQALRDYSSRQLRFAFLAHSWAETLDYSPETMKTALSYERTFREFFLNVADTLRRRLNKSESSGNEGAENHKLCDLFQKWSPDDQHLEFEFLNSTKKIDTALCDNFDTRTSLNVLSSLVKECNKRPNCNLIILKDIANFIERMMNIFGVEFAEIKMDKMFSINVNQAGDITSSSSCPSSDNTETIFKYVRALAEFRSDVRRISKSGDAQQSVGQLLDLCDTLRDEILPGLGVRLEDKEVDGASYVVKMVDAATLAKERILAERKEQEKRVHEEAVRLEKLKIQQQREEKMKMPPSEMFRAQTDKYSLFDDKGMPTHDSSGKEISKSALKKLQRLYGEQEARYNKHVEANQK